MKKSRFTEEQIAFALKQADTGTKIDEICLKVGFSNSLFTIEIKSIVALSLQSSVNLKQFK